MKAHIQFGSKRIDYKLEYSDRTTLGITVTSDMDVVVKAPEDASLDAIEAKLMKRAPWIIKQLSYFLTFQPKTPARKYIGGETHLYLGRQYRLKILPGSESAVKIKGKFLEVHTPNKSKVKEMVDEWYLKNARLKFESISRPLIERFKKHKVQPESIILRHMPTRWGSCTPKGKIILNPELIKAPRPCIEYVIIHELCHLVHHEHTQKFLDLQRKEIRDWERWKEKLEKFLA